MAKPGAWHLRALVTKRPAERRPNSVAGTPPDFRGTAIEKVGKVGPVGIEPTTEGL